MDETTWKFKVEGTVMGVWEDLGPSWGLTIQRADGNEERVDSQLISLPSGRSLESLVGSKVRIEVVGSMEVLDERESA